MTDLLAQAEAALEQALVAVHAAENSTPADDAVAVPSAVAETAEALSPVAELVNAHLAASAKPRFLDMGKGYLGPTAINGT